MHLNKGAMYAVTPLVMDSLDLLLFGELPNGLQVPQLATWFVEGGHESQWRLLLNLTALEKPLNLNTFCPERVNLFQTSCLFLGCAFLGSSELIWTHETEWYINEEMNAGMNDASCSSFFQAFLKMFWSGNVWRAYIITHWSSGHVINFTN